MIFIINFRILGCLCSYKEIDVDMRYNIQFKPEHIFAEEYEIEILKSSFLELLLDRCNSKAIFYDQANEIHASDRLFYTIKCIFECVLKQSSKYNKNIDDVRNICDTYFDVKSKKYKKMLEYFTSEVYDTINFQKYNDCTDARNSKVVVAFIEIFLTYNISLADRTFLYEYFVKVVFDSIKMKIIEEKSALNSNEKDAIFFVFCASYIIKENKNENKKNPPIKNVKISNFVELEMCLQKLRFCKKNEIVFELNMHRTFLKILSSLFFDLNKKSVCLDYNQFIELIYEMSFDFIMGMLANYKPKAKYKNCDEKSIILKRSYCNFEFIGYNNFLSKCNLEQTEQFSLAVIINKIDILITLLAMHAIVSSIHIKNDASIRILNYIMSLNLHCYKKVIFTIDEDIIDENITENADFYLQWYNDEEQCANKVTEQIINTEKAFITHRFDLYIIKVYYLF